MSTANKVLKNTGFLYAKMGITMFISLYTTRLILNVLGASDFGIFNIVGGAIAMLGFLNAAMASATQRFMSYSEGQGDKQKQTKVFNTSFLLHIGIALVAGLLLIIAGSFFFNGLLNIEASRTYAAKVVYGSLVVSTMFTIMTVPYDALLNAHENMLYYSIVGVLESFLKLGVALAVVYLAGDKLVIYGVLMACIPLITLTIMRVYCHKRYQECNIKPRKYWDKSLMKEMTGFAGWNFLTSASSLIANYGQGIVVNIFFGTIINAAMGIANQLNGQLSVFSSNMLKAVNPVLYKSEGAGNRNNLLKISITGSKFSFFLLALFVIPVFVEMDFILSIWLKEIPNYTVVFCQLQLALSLILQLFVLLNTTLSAQGRIAKANVIKSVIIFLPLPIMYFLFKNQSPPYYLYIVVAFFQILRESVNLYFVNKYCGLKYAVFFNCLLRCIIVFFVTISVAFYIHSYFNESLLRVFVVSISSTAVLFACIFYIGLNLDERQIIIKLLNSILKKSKLVK